MEHKDTRSNLEKLMDMNASVESLTVAMEVKIKERDELSLRAFDAGVGVKIARAAIALIKFGFKVGDIVVYQQGYPQKPVTGKISAFIEARSGDVIINLRRKDGTFGEKECRISFWDFEHSMVSHYVSTPLKNSNSEQQPANNDADCHDNPVMP